MRYTRKALQQAKDDLRQVERLAIKSASQAMASGRTDGFEALQAESMIAQLLVMVDDLRFALKRDGLLLERDE